VPDDPQSPFVTSGIRLGTPALTPRGMGEAEMDRSAALIDRALSHLDDATVAAVLVDVEALRTWFPRYPRRPRKAIADRANCAVRPISI